MKEGDYCIVDTTLESVIAYMNKSPGLCRGVLRITHISTLHPELEFPIECEKSPGVNGSFKEEELIVVTKEDNPEYFL